MKLLEKKLQNALMPAINRLLAITYAIYKKDVGSDISPKAYVALVDEIAKADYGHGTDYEKDINDYFMLIDSED